MGARSYMVRDLLEDFPFAVTSKNSIWEAETQHPILTGVGGGDQWVVEKGLVLLCWPGSMEID